MQKGCRTGQKERTRTVKVEYFPLVRIILLCRLTARPGPGSRQGCRLSVTLPVTKHMTLCMTLCRGQKKISKNRAKHWLQLARCHTLPNKGFRANNVRGPGADIAALSMQTRGQSGVRPNTNVGPDLRQGLCPDMRHGLQHGAQHGLQKKMRMPEAKSKKCRAKR